MYNVCNDCNVHDVCNESLLNIHDVRIVCKLIHNAVTHVFSCMNFYVYISV